MLCVALCVRAANDYKKITMTIKQNTPGTERERETQGAQSAQSQHIYYCIRMLAATQDAKDAICNAQHERSTAQHATMLATIRANLQNHAIQSRIRNGAGAPILRASQDVFMHDSKRQSFL